MTVLELAIGWLAPPDCIGCGSEGRAICELCRTAEILPHGEHCGFCGAYSPGSGSCRACRRKSGAPRAIFISTDYDGLAKNLLRAYKFGHMRAAAKSIAEILCDTLAGAVPGDELAQRRYLVVAVPSASARVRARGFDHTALLASNVAAILGVRSSSVLGRLGQSRQVGARRSLRLSQPAGQYFARHPDKISGRNILLVDDVITTGATLREATRVLRQAGAKRVDALVFAKRL